MPTSKCPKCGGGAKHGQFIRTGQHPGGEVEGYTCTDKFHRAGKVISSRELQRLSFCNSKKIPEAVNFNGIRKEWVGIGWVDAGAPRGDEVLVVEE